jgi:DNA invertase Pin-like site-specific DNA recombinase
LNYFLLERKQSFYHRKKGNPMASAAANLIPRPDLYKVKEVQFNKTRLTFGSCDGGEFPPEIILLVTIAEAISAYEKTRLERTSGVKGAQAQSSLPLEPKSDPAPMAPAKIIHPRNKPLMTKELTETIRSRIMEGETLSNISRALNIGEQTISRGLKKYLSPEIVYNLPILTRTKITEKMLHQISVLTETGLAPVEIARLLKISQSSVCRKLKEAQANQTAKG